MQTNGYVLSVFFKGGSGENGPIIWTQRKSEPPYSNIFSTTGKGWTVGKVDFHSDIFVTLQIRQKVLPSAYTRALRDPFPPARQATLLAMQASVQYFPVQVCVWPHSRLYVTKCEYTHIRIYTFTHTHIYTYTHIHIYAYTHIHIYAYIHIYTCSHIHM